MRRENIHIAVIDGQGGGLGRAIIAKMRQEKLPVNIMALGTNSTATFSMIKAGADAGATGENAICVNVDKADLIIGPIAIVMADSLMGELTSRMAEAVASSAALKLLIPSTRCNVKVIGTKDATMQYYLDELTYGIKNYIKSHED